MIVIKQITMRLLCLILATAPFFQSFGQAGDTVIIYVENRFEIKISVSDYDDLRKNDREVTVLREFVEALPSIGDQLDAQQPDLVKFYPGTSVTVEPGSEKYNYLFKEGTLSDTGYRDRADIYAGKSTISITAGDLSRISDYDLVDCLEKVRGKLPSKNRHSKTLKFECNNAEVTYLEKQTITNVEIDALNLSLGAGAGLVKNTWVPDLAFEIGASFNRKGVFRHNAYVSTNLLFDFSDPERMNINTFLNAGFRFNVGAESPDWLGVEVGYLIRKEGDLFGDNTFKFGFNWSFIQGRSITVSPHIYMSDNFKTIYPGVRLGIGI